MSTPAYFVFDARIHDRDAMQPYLQGVASSYHAFGGQLLVLRGQLEVVEGDEPLGNLASCNFPIEKRLAPGTPVTSTRRSCRFDWPAPAAMPGSSAALSRRQSLANHPPTP